MVGILDADGRAVGPWASQIDPEFLRRGLRAMVYTWVFEDRVFRAHRVGQVQLLHEIHR
jgi:2-oxoisovalerate dehydrogenase E1 component alpha subunit